MQKARSVWVALGVLSSGAVANPIAVVDEPLVEAGQALVVAGVVVVSGALVLLGFRLARWGRSRRGGMA